MKKMLFVVMMLFASSVFAEGYAGIYGVSTNTTTSEGSEVSQPDNNIAVNLGMRSSNMFGEVLATSHGMGVALGGYANLDGLVVSAGLGALTDKSTGNVPNYGNRDSSDLNAGVMLGLDYKIFSVRYFQYDVKHNYNAIGKVGHDSKGKPIFGVVASSSSAATRKVVMAGLTYKF